jgi:hypothetical protein
VCVYIAEDGIRNKKTWVSCYCKSGLPKILTFKGSRFIIGYREAINKGLVLENGVLRFSRLLISYLSFFRMMSPAHVLSFASVTDPLREGSVTLTNRQIRSGLASLGLRSLKTRSPKFLWSNKAGVNTRYSFLSIGLDMLGIIAVPRIWMSMLKFAFHMGYFSYSDRKGVA